MLNSDELQFFLVVSQEPSLAAAARRLNVTASAVTQRLRALEERLGLQLLHRTARSMLLTDEGALVSRHARLVLGNIEQLADALHARSTKVSGHLRVLAPFGFGRKYLAPLCSAFAARYPSVTVDLQLSDRLGRHPGERWDVAVHIGELQDSMLRVRKLAPNQRVICAAPAYLEKHRRPERPEDLLSHHCLVLRENDEDAALWRFFKGRKVSPVRVTPFLTSNDGESLRRWAVDGHGIIMRSEWDVSDDLRTGRLERLLGDYRLPDANVVVLLDEASMRSARVERFTEFLYKRFAVVPWQKGADAKAE